jgi:hypothetical protein
LVWFRAEPEVLWLEPQAPELARRAQETFERGEAAGSGGRG